MALTVDQEGFDAIAKTMLRSMRSEEQRRADVERYVAEMSGLEQERVWLHVE